MGEYTNNLLINAVEKDIDELKELFKQGEMFRGFDEAFIDFLLEHEYTGDSTDIKSMAKFVRTKFTEAGIPHVHNFREFFDPNIHPSREKAFKICFAFRLNIQETNDFLGRVMFERGIDYHVINEVVYYFGLKNGLSYLEAEELISQIPKANKASKLPSGDILYTDKIFEYIEIISDKESLIRYIEENIESFEYNNATAIKNIKSFWDEITGPKGLAFNEGKIIDKMLNPLHPDRSKKPEKDTRSKEVIDEEIAREKELQQDDYVVSSEDASTWTIYCQIMGLDNQQERLSLKKRDRSLSPIFTNNVLLPLKARDCFPSRQSIDGIIDGECDGKYEKFRKMLIFLTFYTFWAKIIIEKNDVFYCATEYECDKCKEAIDNYLIESGYQELYPGNPYDWIFLWSLKDEEPLNAFREYMREVYIANPPDTQH